MKTGIELIAAERQRQIEVEGWTAEHDQQHTADELAAAATSYAYPPGWCYPGGDIRAEEWPFDQAFYKPSPNNRLRELTKAGALIAAAIDRLQAQ